MTSVTGLLGCGGESPSGQPQARLCDAETRADGFTPGIQKRSAEGTFTAVLDASTVDGEAGPPDRGDNVWSLRILDDAGASMPSADVRLRPWMPDHGHGTTPELHDARAVADGYEVGPFYLRMGGYWEFSVTVTSSASTDTAMFAFCAEG